MLLAGEVQEVRQSENFTGANGLWTIGTPPTRCSSSHGCCPFHCRPWLVMWLPQAAGGPREKSLCGILRYGSDSVNIMHGLFRDYFLNKRQTKTQFCDKTTILYATPPFNESGVADCVTGRWKTSEENYRQISQATGWSTAISENLRSAATAFKVLAFYRAATSRTGSKHQSKHRLAAPRKTLN